MGRIRCTGTIIKAKNFHREGKTATGIPYQSVTIGVRANGSTMFVELFGMLTPEILTVDTNFDKITVSYDDRFDEDVIKTVAFSRQHIINDDERHAFISDYDAVQYIVDNIDEMEGKKWIVTGQTTPNVYQGKTSIRFNLKDIYLADANEKESLKIYTDFYFNKDSFDTSDFAEDKKIYIDGYTSEFFNKRDLGNDKGGSRYVPQQLVLDCSKIDFSNEKHMKLLNFKLKSMGINPVSSPTDKIKTKLKKGWYSVGVEVAYQNGAEELEFDESCLTDLQREMVDMGLKTLDDFRPAGAVYGNRVTMWKLTNFNMTGEYSDGMIEEDDFDEDMIFTPSAKVESMDDFEKNFNAPKTETKVEDDDEDDDIEDLFG